jgi:predicted metalloprotease with PDZ domain
MVRRGNDKYFAMLHHWRDDILLHRAEPSPIWLGYRVQTSKDTSGYNVLVYEKGAWVLHMLRVLMLDLPSLKEDRFTSMMQDFYKSYEGRSASTEDFQRKVEEYVGMNMDWFFKDWVYGTGIPTYRVAYRTSGADNGRYRVTLRVEQQNVPNDFLMYVPVTVDLGEHREARVRVKVSGPLTQVDLPLLPGEPKGLTFDALDGVLGEVKMVSW